MNRAAFVAAAERVTIKMQACRLCPRDCAVDRMAGPKGARCGLGPEAWIYKELLSHGEEAPISPTWLLDLSGCSMRCRFCSEWEQVVRPQRSPAVVFEPQWFGTNLARRKAAGARTISFVGGDPTVSLLAVLRALAAVEAGGLLPVVWNCNGLVGDDAFAELAPLVDCWTIDLKFGTDTCATRLAGPEERAYSEHVHRTLDRVHELPSDTAGRWPRLLIRHLLMPNHLDCCTRPILSMIGRRWPRAQLNLMTTFLPFGPALKGVAGAPELSRMNPRAAREQAISTALALSPGCLVDGRQRTAEAG